MLEDTENYRVKKYNFITCKKKKIGDILYINNSKGLPCSYKSISECLISECRNFDCIEEFCSK